MSQQTEPVMEWTMNRKRVEAALEQNWQSSVHERNDILIAALQDTIENYGTLFIRSTPETLEVIQRPYDPEEVR
jgi:hypothetical protein